AWFTKASPGVSAVWGGVYGLHRNLHRIAGAAVPLPSSLPQHLPPLALRASERSLPAGDVRGVSFFLGELPRRRRRRRRGLAGICRHGNYPAERLVHPIQESLTQPGLLRSQVGARLFRVLVGFRAQDDRQTHGFLDRRASTFSHGSAAAGSASAA